jgi:hypothetical protein
MAKQYSIRLENEVAKKFDTILEDEMMTAEEWLTNAVDDYDS